MDRSLKISIAVLMAINITDAIVTSVLAPTLIFYVTELGGTLDQYGMIMSADSISSLFMMSVYGHWVDNNGQKYKPPYVATFVLGIVGQLIYFSAVLLPKGTIAIGALIIARFVCGMGSAGRTLSYSYVGTFVPMEQQKMILTLVSTSRTIGMAMGPLVNMIVINVDFDLKIGNLVTIPVNPNNAGGLLMASGELFLLCVMLLFFSEQKEKCLKSNTQNKDRKSSIQLPQTAPTKWIDIAKAMCRIDLFLPPIIMAVVMVNFQTILVGLPPVAIHALHWNPVQISYVSVGYSIALFVGNLIVVHLSMKDISDFNMLVIGEVGFFVFGTALYFLWTDQVTQWGFILPAIALAFSYPWIGPANRSSYTRAIHRQTALQGSHGIMQAFLSQSMMIAGIIAPTFIASFVIRDPKKIDESSDSHELSIVALLGPFCSLLCVVGLFYRRSVVEKEEEEGKSSSSSPPSETSNLLPADARNNNGRPVPRASLIEISDTFSRASEVSRRVSVEALGICNPFDTKSEYEMRKSLLKDKAEWEQILLEEDTPSSNK